MPSFVDELLISLWTFRLHIR